MQHSPRRVAVTSALISAVSFSVGWVILRAMDGSISTSYLPYVAAALVGTVWSAWAGYRSAKKRIGVAASPPFRGS